MEVAKYYITVVQCTWSSSFPGACCGGIKQMTFRCRKQVVKKLHATAATCNPKLGCHICYTPSHVFQVLWQVHIPQDMGSELGPDSHLLRVPGMVFKENAFHIWTRAYRCFHPSVNTRSGTRAGAASSESARYLKFFQLMETTSSVQWTRPGQWTAVAQHISEAFTWCSFFYILVL